MKKQNGIAVGIAVIVIIALAAVVGYAVMQPKSQTSNTSTPTTNISSQSTTTQGPNTTSTTSQSISKSSSSQQKQGTLAMQLTDPPIMASGASGATMTYNGVAVHIAGEASTTGWVYLHASGTIDLRSSVNNSETIAVAQIQSGVYDQAQINITSGSVAYNNQEYAAVIASGTITATMQQSAQVSSSTAAEAIIDLRTFVINAGNSSSPQFIISSTAKATAEPPSAVTSASLEVGAMASLQGQAWWTAFVDQTRTNLVVSSATLTSTSLNLAMENSGNATADVQTVIITPISASSSTSASLPASLAGSAVFTLSSSGSMQESNTLQGVALLTTVGSEVNAAASTTLSYSGALSLEFGMSGTAQASGIISGQQYLITCMGANTYSSITVVAQ